MRICEVCQKQSAKTSYIESVIAPAIRGSGLSRTEGEALLESVDCKPSYVKTVSGTADICPQCATSLVNEITTVIAKHIRAAHDGVIAVVERVRGCIKDWVPDNTMEFNKIAMDDPHMRGQ